MDKSCKLSFSSGNSLRKFPLKSLTGFEPRCSEDIFLKQKNILQAKLQKFKLPRNLSGRVKNSSYNRLFHS